MFNIEVNAEPSCNEAWLFTPIRRMIHGIPGNGESLRATDASHNDNSGCTWPLHDWRMDARPWFASAATWWSREVALIRRIVRPVAFSIEPLFPNRWLACRAASNSVATFRWMQRLRHVLLGLSLMTIVGAVAGLYGVNLCRWWRPSGCIWGRDCHRQYRVALEERGSAPHKTRVVRLCILAQTADGHVFEYALPQWAYRPRDWLESHWVFCLR
jgi:hypothetical protein